ncbi:MAG: Bug family tripartite tricarboxylate transporter substrate binding protein [Hydrogenophaga sp.]|uniref:Bug family tripartite tricarboxylate transporter substrate binding protein n=1 Tax=Hydrogenophaga sp. TaxID=1904254 RepID=UPI003D0B13F8
MNTSNKISRRTATLRLAAMAGGAASLGALPSLAFAQSSFPERPITLIAPFGGAVDFLARQIALHMAKTLNGSMIVDVKLGGSGTIGLSAVARAAPDGYTIGMGTSTALTSAPHLIKNPGYDVNKSFTYLGLIQTTRQVLVVSPALGVNTVAEFIALAKSKPGKLNFGSSGIGNSIHLAAEQFNADVGIQAVHVPYKTGPETDAAIIAGDVHYAWQSVPSSIALINAGRTKALAVTGETRDPALPNVPSIKEAGYNVLLPEQLFGMVAPANLPPDVYAKLSGAVKAMTSDPEFQAIVRKGGGSPSHVSGVDFSKIVARDSKLWGVLSKRLNSSPN